MKVCGDGVSLQQQSFWMLSIVLILIKKMMFQALEFVSVLWPTLLGPDDMIVPVSGNRDRTMDDVQKVCHCMSVVYDFCDWLCQIEHIIVCMLLSPESLFEGISVVC